MENEIKITYPRTEYLPLNRNIGRYVGSLTEEFIEYGETIVQPDFSYHLIASYEKHEYHEYLSVVIFSSFDIGGAHPDHRIYSVTYDIKRNRFIDIEGLKKKNPNILHILSEESRVLLREKEFFQKGYDKEMFLAGTEPKLENFQNFAFSKEGVIVYFSYYQIAPYYAGSFRVIIPYEKLGML